MYHEIIRESKPKVDGVRKMEQLLAALTSNDISRYWNHFTTGALEDMLEKRREFPSAFLRSSSN